MVSVIRQGEVVQRFDAIQVFQTFRRPLEFQQFIGSTSQTFPGAGEYVCLEVVFIVT